MSSDRAARRLVTITAVAAGALALPAPPPAGTQEPVGGLTTTVPDGPGVTIPPPVGIRPSDASSAEHSAPAGSEPQPAPPPGPGQAPFEAQVPRPLEWTRDGVVRKRRRARANGSQRRAVAKRRRQHERTAAKRRAARRDRHDKARRRKKPKAARKRSARNDRRTAREGDPLASAQHGAKIPNFFIGSFRIPPFLLSIYQAAGIQYGIPWEVLAAINEIETDYGRNLNVSSAGALGWMQFMPPSWRAYGVDANEDGRRDPYNPVDAIFAAARYLRAAGAEHDLRRAIFAYNHADWYVRSVLARARLIAALPSDLVGSLTGLTQGRSPVAGRARYRDDTGRRPRRGRRILARPGTPVVAVQDGRIVRIGHTPRLGRFVMLRDAYGNTYTYAHLAKRAGSVLVPKERAPAASPLAQPLALPAAGRALPLAPGAARGGGPPLGAPPADPAPSAPASAGSNRGAPRASSAGVFAPLTGATAQRAPVVKERLFANPGRRRSRAWGGRRQILEATFALPASASLRSYFAGSIGLRREELELRRLVEGRRVIAGTILGRIGRTAVPGAPHVLFEIRPPGLDVPRIDPRPFLDGWRLLESTAIYRARASRALTGGTIGQILLMSKDTLARRVLANPAIDIYACGRRDIAGGLIDRRVLATLELLAASGLRPTVSSLRCGHGFYTDSGNVSHHSSGNGVDIVKVNGTPILGNQGRGTITDATIRRLLTLQGTMAPAQIISLMRYPGESQTLALSDHADHIHIGFRPQVGAASRPGVHVIGLAPSQWLRLVARLGRIGNPAVPTAPSRYALRAERVTAPRRP